MMNKMTGEEYMELFRKCEYEGAADLAKSVDNNLCNILNKDDRINPKDEVFFAAAYIKGTLLQSIALFRQSMKTVSNNESSMQDIITMVEGIYNKELGVKSQRLH